MVTAAKRRSNNKWDQANMTVLSCKVRRDYAEHLREVLDANGDTLNSVIKRALDAYLEDKERSDEK